MQATRVARVIAIWFILGCALIARAYAGEEASGSFIPASFAPPTRVATADFYLVPLGPELVDIDYAAYMSSISHLQTTFTRSTAWPTEDIGAEAAMQDMLNEQGRFERRESFAYGVLTTDGTLERGCVYVRPASKQGFDAEVLLWVTQAEFDDGFDPQLFSWVKQWVQDEWPFAKVAYPGRDIPWDVWDALPAS